MKKFVFPVAILALLVGCSGKPELRKDIAQFIAKFSLEAALEQYKTGGYVSTKISSEGEATAKEVIELEYTFTDINHPTYVETTTVYENDVVTSTNEIRFVQNDDGDYLSTNGELAPYSAKDVIEKLIVKFFYKQVDIDGTYHTQGFYYGDYLKEVAAALQQYVTIDQEKELYIHDYSVNERNTDISQKYIVNKWGMMEENHLLMENEDKSLRQDIIVHN